LGLLALALESPPAVAGGCAKGGCCGQAMSCGQGGSCAASASCAPEIIGKQARKNIRHFLYAKNLSGDKQRIYQEWGFAPERLRTYLREGVVTETWTYRALGREFVFDGESRLMSERAIPVDAFAAN
jgi:hypothetical protein